jgi:hypothetical protein
MFEYADHIEIRFAAGTIISNLLQEGVGLDFTKPLLKEGLLSACIRLLVSPDTSIRNKAIKIIN